MLKDILKIEGVKSIPKNKQMKIKAGDCGHTHNYCDHWWGDSWSDYSECMLQETCYPRISLQHLLDDIFG